MGKAELLQVPTKTFLLKRWSSLASKTPEQGENWKSILFFTDFLLLLIPRQNKACSFFSFSFFWLACLVSVVIISYGSEELIPSFCAKCFSPCANTHHTFKLKNSRVYIK